MFDRQRNTENQRQVGQSGEGLAEGYLRSQGYRIIERNIRLRQGEIDLIAIDGKEICFVEVKTRRSHLAGSGLEAVDRRKQRKLSVLAALYLQRKKSFDAAARFDVVEVGFSQQGDPIITLVKNAFDFIP